MPLTKPAKNDLMLSVRIELERMFTILTLRKSPDEIDYLLEVEIAMKSSLNKMKYSTDSPNSK